MNNIGNYYEIVGSDSKKRSEMQVMLKMIQKNKIKMLYFFTKKKTQNAFRCFVYHYIFL